MVFLLIEINARSIFGDFQHRCRTTNENCTVDENGHKASQHDYNLEHISPDHSFHAPLLQTGEGRNRQAGVLVVCFFETSTKIGRGFQTLFDHLTNSSDETSIKHQNFDLEIYKMHSIPVT